VSSTENLVKGLDQSGGRSTQGELSQVLRHWNVVRSREILPMPLPRAVARINRWVTNRLLTGLATRLPGFGVVIHIGRRSRRQYRTPVNVFRRGDRFIFALTYGLNSDWVRNVLAEGGCALETRGRTLRLSRPRLFHDESRYAVPAPVRLVLGIVNVYDFLELTLDDEGSTHAIDAA
jgi:deazaflavin-dependent oxidoreductase (nitroreductase family)